MLYNVQFVAVKMRYIDLKNLVIYILDPKKTDFI